MNLIINLCNHKCLNFPTTSSAPLLGQWPLSAVPPSHLAKIGFDFSGPRVSELAHNLSLHPYAIHAVFILGTVLSNIIMLRFFAISIGKKGVTKATVYNFAVTYVESVALGYFVFGEEVTF